MTREEMLETYVKFYFAESVVSMDKKLDKYWEVDQENRLDVELTFEDI